MEAPLQYYIQQCSEQLSRKAHDDIFNNTNIVFDNEINVNVEEMKTIVNGLACNKSPGLDGVSAEHS